MLQVWDPGNCWGKGVGRSGVKIYVLPVLNSIVLLTNGSLPNTKHLVAQHYIKTSAVRFLHVNTLSFLGHQLLYLLVYSRVVNRAKRGICLDSTVRNFVSQPLLSFMKFEINVLHTKARSDVDIRTFYFPPISKWRPFRESFSQIRALSKFAQDFYQYVFSYFSPKLVFLWKYVVQCLTPNI